MVSMTMPVGIYTIEDLEREREHDHGLRFELLDGEIVVTPSPIPIHQDVGFRLGVLLDQAVPPGVHMYLAPLDVHIDDKTMMQPDVLLVDENDIGALHIDGVPILAVEILSPSSRGRDLVTKLNILQREGCPHYWVVDPVERTMWMWRLVSGAYQLVVEAKGDDEVAVREPVELTFRVNDLFPDRG